MKLVAISDTHGMHEKLTIPECDILIHAGDESPSRGSEAEIRQFARWFNRQSANHKIWVPGNHSVGFQAQYPSSLKWFKDECPGGHALVHESLQLEGLNFFGSPWTPVYGDDWAYNAGRTITEAAFYRKPFIGDLWAQVPRDINVLITHGPAYDILDEVFQVSGDSYNPPRSVGCVELRKLIEEIRPDIHICGHVHSGHGQKHIDGISFYNVAICDEMHYISNPVTEIEL